MQQTIRIVGLGGSLRKASTSRSALAEALEGAAAGGAKTELIWLRDLELPLYSPEHAPPPAARELADKVHRCDAMIWSTPTYHGSLSGALKNALDWLILLGDRAPPYLTNKPIGLISTAGGVQGLQAVNSMDFITRALRGWSVPLVLPIAQSWQAFDDQGALTHRPSGDQLRALGAEVLRAARQFRAEGTCDYAPERQFATLPRDGATSN